MRAPPLLRLAAPLAGLVAAAVFLAGPRGAGARSLPTFSHIFVVVMENRGFRQAVASPALRRLMHRYAYATQAYGVAHPSLPNYLALSGGSTFGITSDCWFCYVRADNLAHQLASARIPFGLYLEGLPSAGWLGPYWPLTSYAGKHNPWRYYEDIRSSPALAHRLQPLPALYRLLAGPADQVPRFVWVTPNLCHDGHDCRLDVAASWLQGFVARVTASAAWKRGGVLLVTWDEGSGGDDRGVGPEGTVVPTGGGGHILSLVIAPNLPAGEHVDVPLNHYSLLKFVEQALGLPLLGQARNPRLASYAVFWSAARPQERCGARLPGRREEVPPCSR